MGEITLSPLQKTQFDASHILLGALLLFSGWLPLLLVPNLVQSLSLTQLLPNPCCLLLL